MVSLVLHNTLSGQKEAFEPAESGRVRMYVCGPTVYDDAHLGHARCYITWDVLYRFLQFLGYEVRYARNITDVDDKILNRAAELEESIATFTERYIESFHADMAALNVLPPTDEPRATQYIDEMIAGIGVLIQKGAAYAVAGGSVYYRASVKADYGKLSKKPLDDLKAGARVEVDPLKESPLDFALWKEISPEDPNGWQAPWGWGRPGWHMECSAMNHRLFGPQIDIHAGGSDLVFPHHENEIAQSEAWTGCVPFARYWMHNGFVNVSGEKMSKSLGNFATVKTVLQAYDANTLRYFLLTNHYRMPVDFNDNALQGARNRMVKIHRAFKTACEVLGLHPEVLREYPLLDRHQAVESRFLAEFEKQMADDLNTPQALATLDDSISAMNIMVSADPDNLAAVREKFAEALSIFACLGFNPGLVFSETASLPAETTDALRIIYRELTGEWLSPEQDPLYLLNEIIAMRHRAKEIKNWTQADAIRKHLSDIGITLMDSKEGTSWELAR